MYSIQKDEAFRRMSDEIRIDPTRRPIKRVYNAEVEWFVHQEDEEKEAHIPTFGSMKSRMGRVRASLLPPNLHDIGEVVIEGEWAQTWRGRQFLSFINNNVGFAVFVTEEHIRLLERYTVIFIDGTFKICPHPYIQLLTIHGKCLGGVSTIIITLFIVGFT